MVHRMILTNSFSQNHFSKDIECIDGDSFFIFTFIVWVFLLKSIVLAMVSIAVDLY